MVIRERSGRSTWRTWAVAAIVVTPVVAVPGGIVAHSLWQRHNQQRVAARHKAAIEAAADAAAHRFADDLTPTFRAGRVTGQRVLQVAAGRVGFIGARTVPPIVTVTFQYVGKYEFNRSVRRCYRYDFNSHVGAGTLASIDCVAIIPTTVRPDYVLIR